IVLVDPARGWTVPPSAPDYASLTLRGIALGGEGWAGMTLPSAGSIALELCSVLFAENRLELPDRPAGSAAWVALSETAGLELAGAGTLAVADSIVDAGSGEAIVAPVGEVVLDRVSLAGAVDVRVVDASEVIFDGTVTVEDRFHGCVRYSRVRS